MTRKRRQQALTLLRAYEHDPSPVQTFGPSDHLVRQTGTDLLNTAKLAPKGLYRYSTAAMHDEMDMYGAVGRAYYDESKYYRGDKSPEERRLVREDFGRIKHAVTFPRTRELATATAGATAKDFRHPLRHPGYTLLDGLMIAGGATAAARNAAALGRVAVPAGRVGVTAARAAREAGEGRIAAGRAGVSAVRGERPGPVKPPSRLPLPLRIGRRVVTAPVRGQIYSARAAVKAYKNAPVASTTMTLAHSARRGRRYAEVPTAPAEVPTAPAARRPQAERPQRQRDTFHYR